MFRTKAATSISFRFHALSLFAVLLVASAPSLAQIGRLEASVGYPIPASNITLPNGYVGKLHLGMAYSHRIAGKYRVGAGLQYTLFRGDIFFDVKIHLLTTSAYAAYLVRLSRRLGVEWMAGAGYGWVYNRTNEIALVEQFDASGPFVSPGTYLTYRVSEDVAVRSGIAYNVVFQRRPPGLALEDDSIRYFVLTTGFALTL